MENNFNGTSHDLKRKIIKSFNSNMKIDIEEPQISLCNYEMHGVHYLYVRIETKIFSIKSIGRVIKKSEGDYYEI